MDERSLRDSDPPLGAFDVFRDVESWGTEEARYWIDALNKRAAAPDQVAARARLIEQIRLKPGHTALELGCGTGYLLADLAQVIGVSGQAYGLEPQPFLAREAERHLIQKRLTNGHILCARAEAIPLADTSIDVCVAQTTLIHIPSRLLGQVFTEVRRVLKPGGSFTSVDQDGDTWVIDHPQRALTRKIIQFNSDYRYADGWTGRYLRRLFRQNGFADVSVQTWTHCDTEQGSYLHGMAHRIAQAAAEHGVMSREQCQDWLQELDRQAAEGNFFSSIGFFCCRGKKLAL